MDLDPKRLLVLHMLAEELDGAAHAAPVEIGTVDQFERYCAAEILRSDDPTRAGRPESRFASSLAHESPTHAGLLRCGLHPDLLPYHVLWWDCLEQQGPLVRRINRPPLPERDLRDYRSQDTRRRILDRAAAIGRTLRDAPPDRA